MPVAPVIEYFEVKAKNIVHKYSLEDTTAAPNTCSKHVTFNHKMQKVEQELDGEINGILSSLNNSKVENVETLINDLFFFKEKAKLEFTQINRPN